jgi:hypothetical protein
MAPDPISAALWSAGVERSTEASNPTKIAMTAATAAHTKLDTRMLEE